MIMNTPAPPQRPLLVARLRRRLRAQRPRRQRGRRASLAGRRTTAASSPPSCCPASLRRALKLTRVPSGESGPACQERAAYAVDHVSRSGDLRDSTRRIVCMMPSNKRGPMCNLFRAIWRKKEQRASAVCSVTSATSASSPASAGWAGDAAAAEVRADARPEAPAADPPPLDLLPLVFAVALPDAPFRRFAGRSYEQQPLLKRVFARRHMEKTDLGLSELLLLFCAWHVADPPIKLPCARAAVSPRRVHTCLRACPARACDQQAWGKEWQSGLSPAPQSPHHRAQQQLLSGPRPCRPRLPPRLQIRLIL